MTDPLVHAEEAIEPDIAIVDPHHHVWDDLTNPLATYYPLERLLDDLRGGHRIVGSVYAECTSHWRTDGPLEMRPVGETEWIVAATVPEGVMAGIVGYADLRSAADGTPVLEAHVEAGAGRFRGVRHSTAWDPHADVPNTAREVPPGTLTSPGFVGGVKRLGEMGLTFDAWMYFHQLPELVDLAAAVPDVKIVLNHLGGPLAIGPYAQDREAMLREWRSNLARVAELDNVTLKIGGLGFPYFVESERAAQLRGSDAIAAYWRPEVDFAVEAFGPERCMFESNYPVDSYVGDYITLWNAFKKLTTGCSPDERTDLFRGTAARTYGLESLIPQ